jgi:hypothetical protein
MLNAKV